MRFLLRIVAITLLFTLVAGLDTGFSKPNWQSKVDPWILSAIPAGETEFILLLSEQADLSQAYQLKTKQEKGEYVYRNLKEVANRTQSPITTELSSMGAEFRPFWIANMIWVRGDVDVLTVMAQREDIAHIYANPEVLLDEPDSESSEISPQKTEAIEWNILKVRAPEVWAAGFTGEGIVIGGQDTGYDWDHQALLRQYRGWDGMDADHDYNWHDAIHESNNNPCGSGSAEPCDDHSHGTHTMGTMVGEDSSEANQIGMAPGAKWIGCRNMDRGIGTPVTYSECFQWFIAPTDLNDQNPDPSKAPDIINNSWSCPPSEGCTDPNVLLAVVEAVHAAGIVTVNSAGNDGPSCASIDTPAAIYDVSFTVGNTTSNDEIAFSSSRGPVTVDGSQRLKPDISAPGTLIRSSVPGDGYSIFSGTSMAGPHVSGLTALLFSAQPELIGQVDLVERLITRTAVPIDTVQECGGIPGTVYPNNIAGWGRIDALNALQGHALWLEKTASEERVAPGGVITYTLTVAHSAPLSPTTNVVLTDLLPENTTFLDATSPYSFDGTMVRWEFPSMEPFESRTVTLSVRVAESITGTILNDHYQVVSDEVATPVEGDPVETEVYLPVYLPWIMGE
jgi:serine protease AprX